MSPHSVLSWSSGYRICVRAVGILERRVVQVEESYWLNELAHCVVLWEW